jgi:hypothetical protein
MLYGGAIPALSATYAGFVNGDNSASLTTGPSFSTAASSTSAPGPYPITVSGAASLNYAITYNPGTMTVGKAPLTVTADNQTMPLGGPLPPLTVSITGFVNGEDVASLTTAPTGSTLATATSPAGPYPITPGGGVSMNYSFNYVPGTLNIATAILTITAEPAGSVYGAPLVSSGALTVTYSGFVNGDGPGSMTMPPTVANTAGVGSPAGTYTLTPSGAVNPNYTINYVTGNYTISPAALTITAADQNMTYGGAVPPLTATYTGFVNGDNAASLTTPPAFSTTASPTSPPGPYPITVTGAANSNYAIGYQPGTMTVGKAPLTVKADDKAMALGGPLPPLTVSITGFVNGDNVGSLTAAPTASTTATAGSPAGGYAITAGGGASLNYSFNYLPGTLTVATALLTITANPAGSVYGAPLLSGGALTVSYSGFVNGDGPGSMTVPPTVANTALPGSPVGTYTLTPSGAVNPNYTIQYVTGNYTISQAALTITAANQNITYGGTVPPLNATYAGFVNGDNAGSLTTPPTLSTLANQLSPAGPYTITASGAVDPNYSISYQPGTLTVDKALLTVTADNKAMSLGGPLPPLTVRYTGFVNGDNAASLAAQPTASTTATPASPAGNYPITASGGSSSNYSFSYVDGTLTVATAVLNITASPSGSVYGDPLVPTGSLPISYTGFLNGDGPNSLTVLPTITNTAYPGAPVGTYTLIPSGAVDPNYTIQYNNGDYTIRPAVLTVSAADQSITYGGAVPPLTASYSGFVNGDNLSRLITPATVATTVTPASPAGAYPITVSGAVSPNYNFVYNPGTLTVNPAALAVTATPQTKVYGSADPALAYTASGYLNGDNTGIFTGSLSRAAGENVGTYPITLGSLSGGNNYTLNYTGSLLTITVAPQHITWGQSLMVGCNSTTQVQLTATASSGLPVTYSVPDTSVASVSGNVLTLLHPGSTVVTATQTGDANHTAAPPVTDTVFYQSASLIRQHWTDAIFFDNSGGNYLQWQWYKDGQAVAGATNPYYSETPTLNGKYYVVATNLIGQQIQSCILAITGGAPLTGGISVRPNPASAGTQVTVTSNYTSAALPGAVMQIVDLTGRVRQQITAVQPAMQVTMPAETGIYVINLLLASGQKASTNVLVVK